MILGSSYEINLDACEAVDASVMLRLLFNNYLLFFSHLEVFLLFQQVSHGAIQFTAYEELRKVIVDIKSKDSKTNSQFDDKLLVSLCTPYYLSKKSLQSLFFWYIVPFNCMNVHVLEVSIYTPG